MLRMYGSIPHECEELKVVHTIWEKIGSSRTIWGTDVDHGWSVRRGMGGGLQRLRLWEIGEIGIMSIISIVFLNSIIWFAYKSFEITSIFYMHFTSYHYVRRLV